ncbi:MAG: hypothetical protein AAF411_19165 [Myxococcota bacterium]
MRVLIGPAFITALVACHGAAGRPVPTRAPREAPVDEARPDAMPRHEAPLALVSSPLGGLRVLLTSPHERRQLLISNNLRFVRDEGGPWRALAVSMDAEIVAVARIGARWLFASASGAVGISDAVDGPLEHLVDLPVRPRRGGWGASPSVRVRSPYQPTEHVRVLGPGSNLSQGRLPILSDPPSPTLYMIDGHGALREHRFTRVVRSAAFESATLGAAVLEDGSVQFTRDGGASWALHDLGEDRGQSVIAGPPLTIRGAQRSHTLGPGRFQRGTRAFSLRRIELVHAMSQRGPVRAQRNEFSWREEGVNLIVDEPALYRAGLQGEGVELAQEFAFLTRRCAPVQFGEDVLLACRTNGQLAFDVLERGDAVARALTPPLQSASSTPLWFVDSNARTVWAQARCEAGDEARSWCRIGREQRRSMTPEVAFEAAIGVSDGLLVGWLSRSEGIRAVDGVSGAHVPIEAIEAASAESRMGIAADGSAWIVHPATGELWVGEHVRAFERRILPRGARGAMFVDGTRGVAFGRSGAELWWTASGGEHWRPLAVRFAGDRSALPLYGAQSRHGCTRTACALGPNLEVHWAYAEALAPAVGRAHALERPDARAPYPSLPHGTLAECGAPDEPTADRSAVAGQASFVLLPGLRMRCAIRPERWRCRFDGETRREFGLSAGPIVVPMPHLAGIAPNQEGFFLAGGGSTGVVLQRNGTTQDEFLFVHGRQAQRLRLASPLLEQAGIRERTRYPGGWLVHEGHAFAFFSLRSNARALVRFDGAGEADAVVPIPHQRSALLAVHRERPGALTHALGGGWLFWRADGSAPEDVTWPSAEIEWCREASPNASIAWSFEQSWVGRTSTGQSARIRWSSRGACVDDVRIPPWNTVGERRFAVARRWRSNETHVRATVQRPDSPLREQRCAHP